MGVRGRIIKALETAADSLADSRYRTELNFGCKECPSGKSVSVLGNYCIRMSTDFPASVTLMVDQGSRASKVFEVMTGPQCDHETTDVCEYTAEIERWYDEVSANPKILESNFTQD
jgi:hypothetical protein